MYVQRIHSVVNYWERSPQMGLFTGTTMVRDDICGNNYSNHSYQRRQ